MPDSLSNSVGHVRQQVGTEQQRERSRLTVRYSFDSYLTMYVERGREGRLAPGQFERIAKALADPRRFTLLEAIATNTECPYHDLCRDFPVSKATISHHLKELVQAGLVDSEREGQFVNTRVRRDVVRAYAAELMRRLGVRATGRATA